jgi:hypothetical protein
VTVVQLFVIFGAPLVAAGLAWWNRRAGRANLRGAFVLGGIIAALFLARWALTAHHVFDTREVALFSTALGYAVSQGLVMAVLYLALEPFVRKRWPWRLVGWNRLLAGRVRDPLVARDVLVGLAVGTGAGALLYLNYLNWPIWAPDRTFLFPFHDTHVDPAQSVLNPLIAGSRWVMTWFFLLFLIHWVCRKPRVGMVVFVVLMVVPFVTAPVEAKPWVAGLSVAVTASALQFIGLRYGLLAFLAAMAPLSWLVMSNWSFDVRAWYATGPNLGVAVMLALTLYAAYTAVGPRRG